MNSDLLNRVGEQLFGSRWQSDLARALGVTERTMRRWVEHPDGISPERIDAMIELCKARRSDLSELVKELRRVQ